MSNERPKSFPAANSMKAGRFKKGDFVITPDGNTGEIIQSRRTPYWELNHLVQVADGTGYMGAWIRDAYLKGVSE